jgi:uncharacterized protein YcbX
MQEQDLVDRFDRESIAATPGCQAKLQACRAAPPTEPLTIARCPATEAAAAIVDDLQHQVEDVEMRQFRANFCSSLAINGAIPQSSARARRGL